MKLFVVKFDGDIKVYKTMKLAQRAVELYSSENIDEEDAKPEIEEFDVDIPQSKREIYVCEEQVEYGPGYSTGEIRNDCYYRDDYESNSYYYLFNHKSDAYKKCYDDAYNDIKRYFDSYIDDYMYCDYWDVEYIESKNLYKIYEFNDEDDSRKLISEFKGPKYGKYFSGEIGMDADDRRFYAVRDQAFSWYLDKGDSSLTSMSRISNDPYSLPYSIENRTYNVFKVKIKGRL